MAEARGKMLVGATIVVTALFFVAVLAYAYWGSGGWYEQRIEACDTGGSAAVATAIDESGQVHIVYHGLTDDGYSVRHAVRTGGAWHVSTVGATADSIYNLRVFIDDTSEIRMSWCMSQRGFSYASGSTDGFDVVSVDIDDYHSGAIAIDSSSAVHGLCAIQRWNNTWPGHWEWEFQHWTISSGEWMLAGTYDIPDHSTNAGVVALLIHGDDDPQALISYRSNLTESSYRARAVLTDSGLEFDSPFMFGDFYSVSDVELDSEGMMHLAVRADDYVPKYSHWSYDGMDWAQEQIDYSGESPWTGADLLIDDQDEIHIAYIQEYFSFDISRLKVAEKMAGRWVFTTLDCGNAFGFDRPALAVDSAGDYHVAHFVFDGKNKNVMTYVNSNTDEVLVESAKNAAVWTALAAVIGWPTAFAALRWRMLRRQRRERLEKLGLFDDQLNRLRWRRNKP